MVTRKDYGSSYATGTNNIFKYIIPVDSVTLASDGTSAAKGSEAGG